MTGPLKAQQLSTVVDMRHQIECLTYESIPIYRKMLHAIVGEGESGKTWVAAHAALDCTRTDERRVLVLDGEMSAPAWKRRMLSLGADAVELQSVYYAEMTDNVADVQALVETCAQARIDLVIWDSALSMLSRSVPSENDNAAVSRVYDRLRDIVRRADVGGLIVDHTTRGSASLVSRGATAKFNALDVSYGVRVAEGSVPGPIEPWSSVISVEKDRHGLLGKRTDREASFFPLSDGALSLSITERDSATHRLSVENPVVKARAQIEALDPPPTSANEAFRVIRGNRKAVQTAFKLWKEDA